MKITKQTKYVLWNHFDFQYWHPIVSVLSFISLIIVFTLEKER